jgi:anti-sigma regulatory factor (Ser/Thr protein kinase)
LEVSNLTGIDSDSTNAYSAAVSDSSDVGAVRRAISAMCGTLGFDETIKGQVAVVVTEMARNMVIHATRGEILVRGLRLEGASGIEIIGVDRGRGMIDITRCMRDGYSTAGTTGNGLGAINRLSSEFEIYSAKDKGTVIVSRIWPKSVDAPTKGQAIGVICSRQSGETACGDAWATMRGPGKFHAIVADGLGHGPDAATASRDAIRIFRASIGETPKVILERIHDGLRKTRGAAVAIAEWNYEQKQVIFAGIGNIAAALVNAKNSQLLCSHNGIVGHAVGRVQEFVYPVTNSPVLILTSDGIDTRWRMDDYPGLTSRDASLIAGVLYRDSRRPRDDATVLVVREPAGRPA